MDFEPNKKAELAAGLLKALAGLTVAPLLLRARVSAGIRVESDKLLARFTLDDETDLYEDARPRVFEGASEEEAVLLLHGFSAGPGQFRVVLDGLEQSGRTYYAPLLTGFGQKDLGLLEKVRAEDWFRDALTAYDLLAAGHRKISVVGHSMGGALAVWLAARRPVDHLVLTNPYIVPPAADLVWQNKFTKPVLGRLLLWWRPVYLKKPFEGHPFRTSIRDVESARTAFHLPALPTRVLFPLWLVRDTAEVEAARFSDLSVVYGVQDDTADIPGLLDRLKDKNISHRTFAFADSGHNVLQDYDRRAAAQTIVNILIGGG